jgi:hypothetical protein
MERHIRLQRPDDVLKARIATVHSSATAVLSQHLLVAMAVQLEVVAHQMEVAVQLEVVAHPVEVADQVVVDQAGERPADRSASLLFTYE